MKRRTFLAAASVLGIAPALSACSSQTSQGSAESLSKDTEAELTLFYWDKAQKPTIEANIAAFNKEYPKIKVTPSVAVYKDYWTKLRTQAEGDQLPDVFWMNGPNFQLYAGNGMLAELDDLQDVAWDKYPKALVTSTPPRAKSTGYRRTLTPSPASSARRSSPRQVSRSPRVAGPGRNTTPLPRPSPTPRRAMAWSSG